MKYRILLAEDEKILGEVIVEALTKYGYEVMLVSNGSDILNAWRNFHPHLFVLDVMLPGKDGFEVARQLRLLDTQTPIIFLTAKIKTNDVIEGFRTGANDYVRKPFSIDELFVRIDRWLKEKYGYGSYDIPESLILGHFTFYPEKQLLISDLQSINLTYKEAMVLSLLYNYRNNIINREYLLEKIWGTHSIHNSRSLDVYITRLRKHLVGTPCQIITLKGIGYRFIVL